MTYELPEGVKTIRLVDQDGKLISVMSRQEWEDSRPLAEWWRSHVAEYVDALLADEKRGYQEGDQ